MRNLNLFLTFVLLLFGCVQGVQAGQQVLRSAWSPDQKPYQFEKVDAKTGYHQITGLDVELQNEVFRRMGYKLQYQKLSWSELLKNIKSGHVQVGLGGFIRPERAKYSYFSIPHRQEVNVFYLRKGQSKFYKSKSTKELLARLQKGKFRLGAYAGNSYSPEIDAYIEKNKGTNKILMKKDLIDIVHALATGRIDGFFADRITAATLAWENGWQGLMEEHPSIAIKENLHTLFSKNSTSKALVEQYNNALESLLNSPEYAKIIRHYMFPVLLSITIQKSWFHIIEIIGTVAFALSGLLIARKENYSIVGALVLAALPAVGGGIIRDILVNRDPVGVLATPLYLVIVLCTVFSGYLLTVLLRLLYRLVPKLKANSTKLTDFLLHPLLVEVCDSFGLASFTVIGVVVAVQAQCTPLWLWGPLLAVITSIGGSIVRDAIRSQADIATLKGEFYAEAAIIWGLGFSLFLNWQTTRLNPHEIFIGVLVTVIGCFITRTLAQALGVRSLMY